LRSTGPRAVAGWLRDGCSGVILGPVVGTTPYLEPLNSTKKCGSRHSGPEEWMRLPSWRHNEV